MDLATIPKELTVIIFRHLHGNDIRAMCATNKTFNAYFSDDDYMRLILSNYSNLLLLDYNELVTFVPKLSYKYLTIKDKVDIIRKFAYSKPHLFEIQTTRSISKNGKETQRKVDSVAIPVPMYILLKWIGLDVPEELTQSKNRNQYVAYVRAKGNMLDTLVSLKNKIIESPSLMFSFFGKISSKNPNINIFSEMQMPLCYIEHPNSYSEFSQETCNAKQTTQTRCGHYGKCSDTYDSIFWNIIKPVSVNHNEDDVSIYTVSVTKNNGNKPEGKIYFSTLNRNKKYVSVLQGRVNSTYCQRYF